MRDAVFLKYSKVNTYQTIEESELTQRKTEQKWFLITFAVILINMIGIKYTSIIIVSATIEYIICFVFLSIGAVQKAFLCYIVFLSNSLEVQYFVTGKQTISDAFYSFPYMPIVGVSLLLLLNIFMFFSIYSKSGYKLIKNSGNKAIIFMHKSLLYMLLFGVLWNILLYLLNDNNVFGQAWYLILAMKKIVRFIIIFLTAESSIMLLLQNSCFYNVLNSVMKSSLFALPIAGFCGAIFGFTGHRGVLKGLSLLPIYSSMGIYLMLFYMYENRISKIIESFIFAILLTAYLLIFPTQLGGKFFLSLFITFFMMFYGRANKHKFVIVLLFVLICILLWNFDIITSILKNSYYLSSKLDQAIGMFSIIENKNTAIEIEQNSNVLFRLDEFVNVIVEYSKKPYLFLFGKGIAGTTLHHTSTFSWSASTSFTSNQIAAGIYVELHESINAIFLKYGAIGMFGLGYLILLLLRKIKTSPWAIFGLTWLIFYFEIYYSMLFGLIAMTVALYQSNSRQAMCI